MTRRDEEALIRRCQRGELDAFAQLYGDYEKSMLGLAYRLLGCREEAEDALQDAFLKLYRSIDRYRFEAAFSSWFYRVVVNVCYDRLGRRKKAATVDIDLIGERMGRKEDHEVRFHLQQAINQLPPRMKTCFVLFAQEGFKQREIAEMLSLSENTIKVQVFEAKARLREALAPRLRGWQSDEV